MRCADCPLAEALRQATHLLSIAPVSKADAEFGKAAVAEWRELLARHAPTIRSTDSARSSTRSR